MPSIGLSIANSSFCYNSKFISIAVLGRICVISSASADRLKSLLFIQSDCGLIALSDPQASISVMPSSFADFLKCSKRADAIPETAVFGFTAMLVIWPRPKRATFRHRRLFFCRRSRQKYTVWEFFQPHLKKSCLLRGTERFMLNPPKERRLYPLLLGRVL